ncbi:MAG: hypothetical protein WC876_08075 [Candidatus Thermoplasmatota archaeon]|jgi:uncharacterized protein with PIN domain
MAKAPVSSRREVKALALCPECDGPLTPIQSAAARVVSSVVLGYPSTYAGKQCKKCGWQVG